MLSGYSPPPANCCFTHRSRRLVCKPDYYRTALHIFLPTVLRRKSSLHLVLPCLSSHLQPVSWDMCDSSMWAFFHSYVPSTCCCRTLGSSINLPCANTFVYLTPSSELIFISVSQKPFPDNCIHSLSWASLSSRSVPSTILPDPGWKSSNKGAIVSVTVQRLS